MGKVKGGGEENTKGQKAKLQKKEAMTKKQAKVEGQKKAKEDEHWQVGANSREEKRAADAAAKDAAKLAKKEAKSAALKAEEEELSKMRAPKHKDDKIKWHLLETVIGIYFGILNHTTRYYTILRLIDL
mmetsp:Transcript_10379/g.12962  ORF Transcript_10379/g.12962 Transcript_10379/m.12962 type:complete len:129 (+) Transcript_10379:36-422(+)